MNRRTLKFFAVVVTVFFASLPLMSRWSYGSEAPIQIEADHMMSVEGSDSVHFSGNVDARQGEVRIRCDQMTVFYTKVDKKKKKENTNQQVEKLYCNGNVQVTKKDWLGTSEHLVYLKKIRQVILTGHAKAWQGPNMVSGSKIIYYLDQGRSEVVSTHPGKGGTNQANGNTGRVKMTIMEK